MKRYICLLLTGLLVLVLVAATPTKAPAAEPTTLILGFTASQTGKLNKESTAQIQGIQLWLEHLEEAGGIKLSDGTVITFDTRFYDDESSKDRVQQLYTKLITDDNADFLISPYSSGLTDAAAVIAEQNGKIMITTGAASDATYKKGYQLVFQLYTPASRYLTGAFDLLGKLDPEAKKVAIVHENDKFSTDVANAAKEYGESLDYEIVLFEGYDSGTTEFGPFINKISAAEPDAIMGGGHFQDGSTFTRQLYEKEVAAKFIAILVAPPEPAFAELGEAALGVVGPSQWEPLAQYTAESAEEAGLEWYGLSVDDFVSDYEAKFEQEPSYHGAGGYAGGLILQKAIEVADSVDPEKVKEALDNMDLLTFYGHVKFDTTEEAHGLQLAHDMVYIQWQKDDEGNLVKQVVWPLEGKSADALYPLSR
ncbi:MAG: amino acid ABC transporter substrate-binding protein [Anaerolineae bacterium]